MDLKNKNMTKYIIKESELRSIIKEAVIKELNEGNFLRSLGSGLAHGTLNAAKLAGLGLVAPGILAQKATLKANDILGGSSTVGGTLNDFFGWGSGKGSSTRNGGKSLTPNKKNKETPKNLRIIKKEYGEPETEAGLGKKLNGKRPLIVTNFLGSGEDVDFGRHYFERGQNLPGSVWNKRLERAEEDLSTVTDPRKLTKFRKEHYKEFKKWLEKRDKVYEIYIKTIR